VPASGERRALYLCRRHHDCRPRRRRWQAARASSRRRGVHPHLALRKRPSWKRSCTPIRQRSCCSHLQQAAAPALRRLDPSSLRLLVEAFRPTTECYRLQQQAGEEFAGRPPPRLPHARPRHHHLRRQRGGATITAIKLTTSRDDYRAHLLGDPQPIRTRRSSNTKGMKARMACALALHTKLVGEDA